MIAISLAVPLLRTGALGKVMVPTVVIASEAKQSSFYRALDCFVASLLAMTGNMEVKAMNIPPGWTLDGKALLRSYRFADFAQAFAFLTRVAAHAEAVDHHPEFTSVWNRVDLRLTSHDADGVTERDVALAAAIDQMARHCDAQ